MCVRSTADTFWQRSAARSSRVFTALWTWRWWPVSGAGRYGGAGGRGAGVEHHLQSRPAHGHRQQRPAQRQARQRRGGAGRGERVFHDGRPGLRAAAAEYLFYVLFLGHPQAGRCVFRLRRAGARHQRRADFAAAGRAWAGLDLVGHAGHGAAGRGLCRGGHAARDAGAAAVLKLGLSAYTPVIGGDVHEALEGLFVRGSVSAADGGEDGRTGGGNGRA